MRQGLLSVKTAELEQSCKLICCYRFNNDDSCHFKLRNHAWNLALKAEALKNNAVLALLLVFLNHAA